MVQYGNPMQIYTHTSLPNVFTLTFWLLFFTLKCWTCLETLKPQHLEGWGRSNVSSRPAWVTHQIWGRPEQDPVSKPNNTDICRQLFTKQVSWSTSMLRTAWKKQCLTVPHYHYILCKGDLGTPWLLTLRIKWRGQDWPEEQIFQRIGLQVG